MSTPQFAHIALSELIGVSGEALCGYPVTHASRSAATGLATCSACTGQLIALYKRDARPATTITATYLPWEAIAA